METDRRVRKVVMDRRVNLALRFCMMAWLAIFRWTLFIGLLVCFTGAVVTRDLHWLIASAVLGGVFLVVLVIFLIESPNVRCLMCGAVMLRPLRCE